MANSTQMKELSPHILHKLQCTQIEILDAIVQICEKHQLQYVLIYGTLIGAIRHEGFIPWDDDLDIAMPRNDYEKFLEIAQSELGEAYFLQTSDTEKEYWLVFAKVRKNHTLFEEASMMNMPAQLHKGIFVDIFPFDHVKKDHGCFLHLQFILSKAIIETMYVKSGIYAKDRKKQYWYLHWLLKCFSMHTLERIQKRVVSCQKNKKCNYIADFNSSRHYLNAVFPKNYFLPTKRTSFEEKQYSIPREYDAYLKKVYGEYMILPKEEDRYNHNTLQILFDTRKKECE